VRLDARAKLDITGEVRVPRAGDNTEGNSSTGSVTVTAAIQL
jgi:hypothetical protein